MAQTQSVPTKPIWGTGHFPPGPVHLSDGWWDGQKGLYRTLCGRHFQNYLYGIRPEMTRYLCIECIEIACNLPHFTLAWQKGVGT